MAGQSTCLLHRWLDTYACTFLDFFLFLRPNVLSSTICRLWCGDGILTRTVVGARSCPGQAALTFFWRVLSALEEIFVFDGGMLVLLQFEACQATVLCCRNPHTSLSLLLCTVLLGRREKYIEIRRVKSVTVMHFSVSLQARSAAH